MPYHLSLEILIVLCSVHSYDLSFECNRARMSIHGFDRLRFNSNFLNALSILPRHYNGTEHEVEEYVGFWSSYGL